MATLMRLQGHLMPYAWGGTAFLPGLLGYENTAQTPQAEYWLGAHPSAVAGLLDIPKPEPGHLLDAFLAQHLQPPLPYLFKVLDVRDMLSLQAHPNDLQAQQGFIRENSLNIPLNAPTRNYKDASAKPEMMLALSEFWMLHGFADDALIEHRLNGLTHLQPLLNLFKQQGLKNTLIQLLEANTTIIQDLQNVLAQHLNNTPPPTNKMDIHFWIYRWIFKNPNHLNGILVLYLLNIMHLEAGEGAYQPAGLLHAYLEGQTIELMANSDNVLRAGLTPKHIDIPELIKIAHLTPSHPNDYRVQPRMELSGLKGFNTPFTSFKLSEANPSFSQASQWAPTSVEILFCYQGHALLTQGEAALTQDAALKPQTKKTLVLHQGESCLVMPGSNLQLHWQSTQGCLFRASVL